MYNVAKLSTNERQELFRATAQAMQVTEAIIEKDFWVCWVLDFLFNASPWKDQFLFKGGTSLSKAYSAIQRMSEDIDLVLSWELIGITEEEAWRVRVGRNRKRFIEEIGRRTEEFISGTFLTTLRDGLQKQLGSSIEISASGIVVSISYPKAFPSGSILPEIKLEIGPRSKFSPNAIKQITPYSAEFFPNVFTIQKSTNVLTLAAEHTFWEKTTILHHEAHRPVDKRLPSRYSRHYYDIYRLSDTSILSAALTQPELLVSAVDVTMQFFPTRWSNLGEALSGRLRLVPPEERIPELKQDYDAMQSMLFGDIPKFEVIVSRLWELEIIINDSVTRMHQIP